MIFNLLDYDVFSALSRRPNEFKYVIERELGNPKREQRLKWVLPVDGGLKHLNVNERRVDLSVCRLLPHAAGTSLRTGG